MAQPATGTTWDAGGFNDVDSRFLDRGGKIAVLVRDDRGVDTDISPRDENGAVKWSAFAADDSWRKDLFAWRRVNGVWTKVATPNDGWHLVGAFKEGDGPKKSASIDSDDYMIEQSNRPFDTDIVKEDEPFSFTGVETLKDLMHRVRNNLRINDPVTGESLCAAPGSDFVASKPVSTDPVDRQVLLLRDRRVAGNSRKICWSYALGKLSDVGDSTMGKRDADAPELTFKPLQSPYFMDLVDGEYRPIVISFEVRGMGATAQARDFTVDLGGSTGGTFKLTHKGQTTADITAGASVPTASGLKSALVALDDGYLAADWTVTGSAGGPFTVTTPAGALTGDGANLTGGTGLVISPA